MPKKKLILVLPGGTIRVPEALDPLKQNKFPTKKEIVNANEEPDIIVGSGFTTLFDIWKERERNRR